MKVILGKVFPVGPGPALWSPTGVPPSPSAWTAARRSSAACLGCYPRTGGPWTSIKPFDPLGAQWTCPTYRPVELEGLQAVSATGAICPLSRRHDGAGNLSRRAGATARGQVKVKVILGKVFPVGPARRFGHQPASRHPLRLRGLRHEEVPHRRAPRSRREVCYPRTGGALDLDQTVHQKSNTAFKRLIWSMSSEKCPDLTGRVDPAVRAESTCYPRPRSCSFPHRCGGP